MQQLAKKVRELVGELKVLFVEDDKALVENTIPVFDDLFGEVDIAYNGQEGLKLYKEKNYDIVITDIRMPVMNGIEMIKEIRKLSPQQKIMVVSAHKEAEYFIELISLGVKCFISKPLDLNQLLSSLNDCLENNHHLFDEDSHILNPLLYPKEEEKFVPTESILVVDDTVDNLTLIANLLKNEYKVKVAKSGLKALEYLERGERPNLILLDIMMPMMDGYEVIEKLKANKDTRDIPVVFLTAKTSVEDEKKGLELGAEDYITKPISPIILKARVKTQLQNAKAKEFLKNKNAYLEVEIEKRTQEIFAIQNVSIQVLSSIAETRDQETGNHIKRTQLYVKLLAQYLSHNPRFRAYLTPSQIKTLYISAPLHDLGKVGIPDGILLKPGKLDEEEFEVMKTHTTLGKNAIERAEAELGYEVDFLKTAKDIAELHHEKYDGTGYPLGLKGDEIPISARLMALADVYDALVSERIYKKGFTHEKALEIILAQRGKHFDPDVVDAFQTLNKEFQLIAKRFQDTVVS